MIVYIVSAIIILAAVFTWACCVAAKRADERIAEMMEGEEENG